MDVGTYSNHANVLVGCLKALGLDRQARSARTLHDVRRELEQAERGAA